MKRFIVTIIVLILAASLWATGTRGGRGYFSARTLEYRTQSEYTVLFGAVPIYRSSLQPSVPKLVSFLTEQDYVRPVETADPRWKLAFHWNEAWKDGYGSIERILYRDRDEKIAWSKANPACARVFWGEGFRLMRSDKESEREAGDAILMAWRGQPPDELLAEIDEIKAARGLSRPERGQGELVAVPVK
jgi:hypothetical protein